MNDTRRRAERRGCQGVANFWVGIVFAAILAVWAVGKVVEFIADMF